VTRPSTPLRAGKYPPGRRVNLLLAIIAQMLPTWFPFDPLDFNMTLAREFGDIGY
jgi:hypothetical protein